MNFSRFVPGAGRILRESGRVGLRVAHGGPETGRVVGLVGDVRVPIEAVLAALPLLFFAAYFTRLAGRVFESGSFPPPETLALAADCRLPGVACVASRGDMS